MIGHHTLPPFSAISFCRVRIAIVRRSLELAAERRFRIGHHGGEIEPAVMPDQERLVVGNEFRKQRSDKQRS